MPFLPCLLCGRKLEKRTSKKNGKPYFVCDSCGIQLFIRKQQGIELLEETFRNLEKAVLSENVASAVQSGSLQWREDYIKADRIIGRRLVTIKIGTVRDLTRRQARKLPTKSSVF